MSDIFSEVNEDLRRDQMQSLWKRYGGYVIGLALGIVAVTAGTEIYSSQMAKARQEEARSYEAALAAIEKGDSDAGQAALAAIAKQDDDGIGVLANLKRAGLLIADGKIDEAAAVYDDVADGGASDVIRALARVRATTLLFDGLSDDEVVARLEPISAEGEPFRHGALELLALSAYRAGDLERANEHLDALILDPGTPPNMRQRAIEVQSVIGDKQTGSAPMADDSADGSTDQAPDQASGEAPAGDSKETAQ